MAYVKSSAAVRQLQAQVKGSVLTPGDADYEQTRRGWNLTVNHYPALIIVPENAQDVIAGVNFARQEGLGVAVQVSGHGIQLPANDALLFVMSKLTGVQVNAGAQTVRVEGGARWHHVLDQAAPLGLAPLVGTTPHVGVVGYTLAGGLSWLGRKYGFAVDSVRSIDVVTPDGVLRHASATENADLFWALRGASGNFGVVTALEFSLYPVTTIYGGTLTYPGDVAEDALRFFREWVKTVPDELTSMVTLLKFPDLPQMPDAIRGKKLVFVRAVYVGDAASGAKLVQPWLDWRAPLANDFREMPFADIPKVSNDPVDPGAGYSTTEMYDSLSDEAIRTIVRFAMDSKSPVLMNEFRHLGGAIARGDANSTAVGHRDAAFLHTLGGLAPTPEAMAALHDALARYTAALKPYVRGSVYQNFMSGGESPQRVKDAFAPATYERLVALKAKYDPDNRFRYSFQLVPLEAPEPTGR